MGGGLGESTSREPQSSSYSGSGNEAGSFECNICFELVQDPVVTLCGHLFCWPCLYKWLHVHACSQECPVCKALIQEDKLVPLYGRGNNTTDPRRKSVPGVNIPNRPTGQRPATAPPPNPSHFPQSNPWFMGGGIPVGGMSLGNYTFSAFIGSMLLFLGFHMHGFHDPGAYGPATGYDYGYSNSFHGGHAQGFPPQIMSQRQQADYYLKVLLTMVGVLVVVTLLWF